MSRKNRRDTQKPLLVQRREPSLPGNAFRVARVMREVAADISAIRLPAVAPVARPRLSPDPVQSRPSANAPGRVSPRPSLRSEPGLDLTEDKRKCLRENRPSDTRGDGSSRPFVPWCQKTR